MVFIASLVLLFLQDTIFVTMLMLWWSVFTLQKKQKTHYLQRNMDLLNPTHKGRNNKLLNQSIPCNFQTASA